MLNFIKKRTLLTLTAFATLLLFNSTANSGELQVKLGSGWKKVCCVGARAVANGGNCSWTEKNRVLTESSGKKLNCPENGGNEASCSCGSTGEAMHGAPEGHVSSSLRRTDGAPIFSNIGRETCIKVVSSSIFSNILAAKFSSVKGNKWSNSTGWPDKSCPHFRLTNFY